MEQLNRIELRGTVGNVRILDVQGKKVAHLSVVTNFAYKDRNGAAVIEATWHNVTAWEGRDIPDPEKISKGDRVWIVGRMRSDKYTDAEGAEHFVYEAVANKLAILPEDEPFGQQML